MPKFVKDPGEQELVKDIMRRHIDTLKVIHIYYASKGHFPFLNTLEFNTFIHDFNLLDKHLTQTIADNNFISAYSNMGKLEGTQENTAIRL